MTGTALFHVSCSDDDMDGPEDCGKRQGNGKDNDGRINDFLFGGMTGENGAFGCPGSPSVISGADVVYGIRVSNPNTFPVEVRVVDASLGLDQTETVPAEDSAEIITDPTYILPDGSNVFENTVEVTTDGNSECSSSDSVLVERIERPVLVSCDDIKDITAVSVIWYDEKTVDIVMESGEKFFGVSFGNRITFQEANTGNDVEMHIYENGIEIGRSKFHVSCSDDNMDGTDDCGKPQGNGKDDDSGWINAWLLDGMIGEKGSFECNLPNTGVVEPDTHSEQAHV